PADILITTPESLYLMLTSNARETLRGVHTVIVDEVHALVPNKRGAHLAISLERLHRLAEAPPQRIGLSATQNPLEEVARYLGGCGVAELLSCSADTLERSTPATQPPRPVVIVNTAEKKNLQLKIEVPVEEMAKLGDPSVDIPTGPAASAPGRSSIWPAIYPRLLELIRAHRSTLVFANSRRLAERLAAALNELAGETLVQAHHGS